MRPALWALALLVVLGIAAIFVYDRLLSRIARDWSILNAYNKCLADAHERTGHYPKKLAELGACSRALELSSGPGLDAWGRELVYEQRDDAYVLLALGIDGRRDPDFDPWALWRERKLAQSCSPTSDSATSDRGLLRACIL